MKYFHSTLVAVVISRNRNFYLPMQPSQLTPRVFLQAAEVHVPSFVPSTIRVSEVISTAASPNGNENDFQ